MHGVFADPATWLWPVVVATLVIAGSCSAPAEDAAEAGHAVPATATVSAEPTADAPADDAAGQVGTERLRLVVVGAVPADPVAASPVDPAAMAVLDLLYDGLTRWDDRTGSWQPDVAASIESGPGARVWVIVVGDRRFSNGRPISSDDVVAGLERLRAESAFVADRLDHVTAIRAVDDRTLRVRLARPDALFPALLSHPLFGVTPPVEPGVNLDGSVSSGRLRVAPGAQMRLVSSVVTSEAVVEVEIVAVADVEAGVALVRSGAADVMHVPPSYDGAVDVSVASGVTVAYALNAASPNLAAAERRRHLVDLVDGASVSAALPGLEPTASGDDDHSRSAGSLDLPGSLSVGYVGAVPGAGDTPAFGRSDRVGVGFDPEATMAAVLAATWRDAGVDVRVERLSLGAFVSLVSSGAHDAIRTGWVELYPGDRPHWRLVDAASPANTSGVGDPDLAALLRRAARSDDPGTVKAVEDTIADLGVLLPIGRFQTRVVTAPGVDAVSVRADGSLVIGG